MAHRQPAGWGAKKGLWKRPVEGGGTDRERGHQVTPGRTLAHCQAIWSQPAPCWGLLSGRWVPLSWLRITRQTEILHFQAVENVKFPCSGLESHQHGVGKPVIVADQTSDWQLGMSLINFFLRETEIIIS